MTQTPPSPAVEGDATFWGRLAAGRTRAAFGAAYALAFLITGAAIWLVAVAPGAGSGDDARATASRAVASPIPELAPVMTMTWRSSGCRRPRVRVGEDIGIPLWGSEA